MLPLSAFSQAAASNAKTPVRANVNVAAKLKAAFFAAPLGFEPNEGQTDPRVKYLARGSGYTLFLTPTEAVFALQRTKKASNHARPPLLDKRSAAPRERDRQRKIESVPPAILRMALVGANAKSLIIGQKPEAQRVNYFIGRDLKKWRAGIQTCAQVQYRDVYPGVNLLYYGNQRQLEYDFQLSPGADAKAIRLKFTGADKVAVDNQGDLALTIGKQTVTQHKPLIYQEIDGKKQMVAGRYALQSSGEVGFAVDKYDHSRPLVIDPVLVYSTYLGGLLGDEDRFAGAGESIAVDASGCAYIAGTTSSPEFPVTAGAFQTTTPYPGGMLFTDFVSKLSADGSSLIYSTYLGGTSGDEQANGIALDASGEAYITGYTASTDFPVTVGALQTQDPTGYSAFVSKLSSDGASLIYSTYLGGSTDQYLGNDGEGIAVDASGSAYVTGLTQSTDFPVTTGAFQTTLAGAYDAVFVSKLSQDGASLTYSTYLGGSHEYSRASIAVDAAGSAYVTGGAATGFPVTPGAIQTTMVAGSVPAFVSKVSPDGSSLIYSTYLGGSGTDTGSSIALDAAGCAFVTGNTNSSDFPVTIGAFQTTMPSADDAVFVSKLSVDGALLLYSTYLGGNTTWGDSGRSIAVDSAGNAYVIGDLAASVTKLSADGASLAYSAGLDGGGEGHSIAVDTSGDAYVTGQTSSIDFPTTPNALQTTNNNDEGQTGFISKISDPLPPASFNLAATAGDGWVALGWEHMPGVDGGYKVYRSTTGGPPYALIATVDGFYYADLGLTNGVAYTYVVTAPGDNGEITCSNPAQATPYAGGPTTVTITVPGTDVPTGTFTTTTSNGTIVVIIVSVSGGNTIITITPFSAPADLAAYATGSGKITLYWSGVPNATGYNIYRGTTSSGEDYNNPVNIGGPVTTPDTGPGVTNMYMYSDNNNGLGLTDGTEYFYTVEAVDGSAQSGPSNEDSDVPNSGNVPWDTGNPSAIISAFRSVFAADVQSAGEDGDYPLRVVGPDNVIYDDSYQTAQPADGTITPGTNQFVWSDGSSISLPDDLGEFDMPSGQEDMQANPDLVGTSLPASYGPYRRVRTTADYRGEEGLLTLPSTFITQIGKANGDTACIYAGASADKLEVDAGLVYSTAHSNWGMFMNINGKPVQPGGKGIPPVHLLNIPKASSVRFPANDTVQVDYWAWGYLSGMTRTKLSLLLADDSLYGSGIRGGLGAPSKYLGKTENISAKRVHAIAQTLPVKSVAPTGSSMEDASWMQGEVWLPNAYPTLQGWSSADGTHTPPQGDGSYDGGNSSVSAYETSPYIQEDNIDIDIDISP